MRRKKNSKKINSKENKILLIVENTEELFFNQYLKNYLKNSQNIEIECQKSGSGNKCEIKNFSKMKRKVVESINDGYKAVFLMIDLDTQCLGSEFNYDCLVELKKDYEPKYNIPNNIKDKFYLFIVCREIENWFLTIDENIRGVTDKIKNAKKELSKLLNSSTNEDEMVKKIISELIKGNYVLNFDKNQSLQYFIKKLKDFNSKG